MTEVTFYLSSKVGDGVRQALAWRIDAKMAQARLLQLAQFGTDDRLRRQAKRSAWLYLSECESLLLG